MAPMLKAMRRIFQTGTVATLALCSGPLILMAQQQLPDAPQPQITAPISSDPAAATPPPVPAESPAPNPDSESAGSPRDQLFTLTKHVNFVLVPTTVKNRDGTLVQGLQRNDFAVYDDGTPQDVTFFTSDPFPLSAAIVLDVGLPEITWKRVKETLPALIGAFSQFDEVALFTYSNVVQRLQDFTGVNAQKLEASLRKLKASNGKEGGVPVLNGPFGGGANVNGIPVDPQTPQIQTYPKEFYVLNDAILRAAAELSRREPTRRKVIFIISDGRELGSSAGYSEVLKVLLSRQISVYAVNVGGGGIPGYRQAEKVRIPGQGYGDILPKYASATGGQVYAHLNREAIEDAYSRITEEARNQYTLGYTTPGPQAQGYRPIEVRVKRPNLKVYARDGYYPLPPEK